jgi:hypothetical protein
MKRFLFLLLVSAFSVTAFGQKMKFKKRQILFDKTVAYTLDKTAGKGLSEFRAFAMITADGDTTLTFDPIELHYDALPYEETPIYYNAYHQMTIHENGETTGLEYAPFGFPNRAFQYMKSTKMLTFEGLDYDRLDAFVSLMGSAKNIIEEYEQFNANRQERYDATVAQYGEDAYVSRKHSYVKAIGKYIKEGEATIGTWENTGKNTSYVIYMIKNAKGDNVAQLHMKLGQSKVVVLPIVDDQSYEIIKEATPISTKIDDMIELAAKKLVNLGYL